MTLLNRKTDYTLLILTHLHRHPSGENARSIADRYELSRPFTANILKELCRKGLVSSSRGVKGGYSLNAHTNALNLAELMRSIDDEFELTVCSGSEDPTIEHEACNLADVCPVRSPLNEVHRRVLDVFRSVTLNELFGEAPKPAPVRNLVPLLTTTSRG